MDSVRCPPWHVGVSGVSYLATEETEAARFRQQEHAEPGTCLPSWEETEAQTGWLCLALERLRKVTG